MSKQKIPLSLRHSIWIAHNRVCCYCSEPLAFSELEIDHIIPESLPIADAEKYSAILSESGLPQDFDLCSVQNLLPAHGRCNRTKSNKVLGTVFFFLHQAFDASEKVLRIDNANRANETRDNALAKLSEAIQSGLLMPSDLLNTPKPPNVLVLTKPLVFADGIETSVTPEQVEGFLDRPVLMGGNPEFDANFGDASGKRMSVRTCREYRSALDANFYALTTYDIKSEAFLKNVNAVLNATEIVRIPTLSYIDRPFRGVADIDLMPVGALPAISSDAKEGIAAMGDLSIRDLLMRNEVKILNIASHEISLEWNHMGLLMRELLRADLNKDGIEDILCECYCWAVEGTLGFGWTSILSRGGPEEKFRVVAV